MNKIYTCGYSGHTTDQLKQAAIQLNAVVVDIRHLPRSRMPEWNQSHLRQVLGPEHYRHLPAWGNANFNAGPVQLVDPPLGLIKMIRLLEERSIILMCGCAEYFKCHRKDCAELFHERGTPTEELVWPESETATGFIKTISLWEPWATLMMIGAERGGKAIETRHWPTAHRGQLGIHAAKTKDELHCVFQEPFYSVLSTAGVFSGFELEYIPTYEESRELVQVGLRDGWLNFSLGAILGTVNVTDCRSTDADVPGLRPAWIEELSDNERAFGCYAPGRFGWITNNPRPLAKPVQYRGSQGFFSVDAALFRERKNHND